MKWLLVGLGALLLSACAQMPRERIILLPGPDGHSSGAVMVQQAGAQSLLLSEAYAQVEPDRNGALQTGSSSAAAVQRDYGALLALQPARARSFVVNFRSNSNELTADTAPVLDEVRAALASLAAGELVVIGHTDRVGGEEANDQLSLQRAETVRDFLIRIGVARELILVAGRGEREPLVPTADEVAEPRNRRVEIKLR